MKAPTQEQLDWWRWRRQGLDEPRGSAADILARSGWMRSVGGAGPYLALFARGRLSRGDVDAALGKLAIHELPSARGCTYVVPAADYAVALRASQGHGDAATLAMAKKHLGVTDKEIDRLCKAIIGALDRGPLDPKGLKEALGDAVRHLGDEGKKRGTTTTLSIGLGLLQSAGEIRRVPEDGRLDRQRYRYARWKPGPLQKVKLDDAALARELATRFFRWWGRGRRRSWRGGRARRQAGQGGDRGALARRLGDEAGRVMFADDLDELRAGKPPKSPPVALVGSLDNLWHLGKLEIDHHAIVAGGARVGVWEFDFDAQKIVWALTTKDKPKGVDRRWRRWRRSRATSSATCARSASTAPRAASRRSPRCASSRVDFEDQLAEVFAAEELAERLGKMLEPLDDVLARLELALARASPAMLHRRLGIARREVEDDEALHARAIDQQRQVILRTDEAAAVVVLRDGAADDDARAADAAEPARCRGCRRRRCRSRRRCPSGQCSRSLARTSSLL